MPPTEKAKAAPARVSALEVANTVPSSLASAISEPAAGVLSNFSSTIYQVLRERAEEAEPIAVPSARRNTKVPSDSRVIFILSELPAVPEAELKDII